MVTELEGEIELLLFLLRTPDVDTKALLVVDKSPPAEVAKLVSLFPMESAVSSLDSGFDGLLLVDLGADEYVPDNRAVESFDSEFVFRTGGAEEAVKGKVPVDGVANASAGFPLDKEVGV